MASLPFTITMVIGAFAPLFSKRVFALAQLLLVGAILAPGQRTVTAVLRVMGKSAEAHFQNYHRVLKRAQWSSLEAGRLLLGLLLDAFVPEGPVVMGIDETIARRRGERLSAKGIYRDPVRSSHTHFVNAGGLRWVCLMLLARMPWVDRVWARPFLIVLAPSERCYQGRGRRPQSLLDRARQAVQLVRRWVPTRELVVVGDSTYAALAWLDAVRESACVITRLRLDAALYAPAPPRRPKQNGRPRKEGEAAADARAPRRGPDNVLAEGHRGTMVWPESTPGLYHLCHSRLVSLGFAASADLMGPHPQPGREICASSMAVDEPGWRPRADLDLVHPTLAAGNHR
jgi:DDE superfamily endonuclease